MNDYYTISEYDDIFKIGWDPKRYGRIGSEITKICTYANLRILYSEKTNKSFVMMSRYPIKAFDIFFEKYGRNRFIILFA